MHLGDRRDCSLQAPPPEGLRGGSRPRHRSGHPRPDRRHLRRGRGQPRLRGGRARSSFLYEAASSSFIEMNTRLQVEHTGDRGKFFGVDLVSASRSASRPACRLSLQPGRSGGERPRDRGAHQRREAAEFSRPPAGADHGSITAPGGLGGRLRDGSQPSTTATRIPPLLRQR